MVRLRRRVGTKADDIAVSCVPESVVDLAHGPLVVFVLVDVALGRHQGDEGRVGCKVQMCSYLV